MFFTRKAFPVQFNEHLPLNTLIENIVFTVFDTETTGFQVASTDRLIEVAAVTVKGCQVQSSDTFRLYVNPERQISQEITELTTITNEQVAGAPFALEAIEQFFDFVQRNETSCLVGHYVAFDVLVLKNELKRSKFHLKKLQHIDTLDLIGFLAPSFDMRDLEKYAQAFGTRIYPRHQALGDALTTAYLFVELLGHLKDRGYSTWGDLLQVTNSPARHLSF
ncbi:exonuclease domain-containing protein [Metabacillus iocasae]|uniref:DNA polymerase-3 subunit epsilon n=1 Tax=Priestia iocasae TaxID=2291674 RepID=A0ABS2QZ80_9BACI|nr:DNA polymerase-3 subunit epsilon [Metabacillus iocasae]